jgi:hypothetical protein
MEEGTKYKWTSDDNCVEWIMLERELFLTRRLQNVSLNISALQRNEVISGSSSKMELFLSCHFCSD